MYTGEIISLIVALSWTVTAICFEYAGKRIGALTLNIVRLMMSIAMLAITLKLTTGSIAPWDAGWDAWKWLVLSGFVGYVFGDFCLFNSYLLIGSRFGQLFMTLAPPTAAIAQLSDARKYVLSLFPIQSGRNPNGSLAPIIFLGEITTSA